MITQLFRISDAIWKGLSREEISATWDDMCTLGIAEPPYRQLTVEMAARSVFQVTKDFGDKLKAEELLDDTVQFHYDFDKETLRVGLLGNSRLSPVPDIIEKLELAAPHANYREKVKSLAVHIIQVLVVLLATKNVVKTTTKNPLAKHGLGKQRALYCTSLSIGKITEECGTAPEPGAIGTPRRPHLRRGHIRRQRHGPSFEFTKQIFIQPCFVNADESFISTRTAYNVSL